MSGLSNPVAIPHSDENRVVFLLTDVEGSSRLHEQYPLAMRAAMARHDACISHAVEMHGGRVLKLRGGGDSVFAVFASPADAVCAAYAMQRALEREAWPDNLALRVRVGLHIGETEERDGDFVGNDVNRCARLRDIGHGGQTLLSSPLAEAAEAAGLPEGVTLRDMGLHRLKDLRQAEYVYQLVAPDILDGFPPLRSLSQSPNNLPERLDSFIGREAEVETIRLTLSPNTPHHAAGSGKKIRAARLLTVTGTGGGGKTRLAIQAGAELLEEFPDGVWFVDLSGLTEGRLVPQAVATALTVREATGVTVTSALTAHCQAKTLLLVLDNCEHLLAGSAALAKTLLQSCPSLRVLATSREAMGVEGEQVYALPTLPTPNPMRLPDWETIAVSPAVRLFAERARARKAGFTVGPDNAELVAKICHRLDGVPFYIELVAPKVNLLSVKEIDARLYTLLRSSAPGLSGKHRNLRALMQWSMDLLTPEERCLLPRLSVFAGGWTMEAAERVCVGARLEEAEIFDALARLVNASLVVAETQEETSRYRLLETVREYAREELTAANEEIETQDRHVAWFLEIAEQCEPKLQGPEQAETLRQLETEHDNFRAALKWADGETRLRLAGALWRFWYVRGYLSEGRAWLQNELARTRVSNPLARAKALFGLGVLAFTQCDYDFARDTVAKSLHLCEDHDDPAGAASALNTLGNILRAQGDIAFAREHYARSLVIRRHLQDLRGEAAALNNLGMTARDMKQYEEARANYEQCLAIYRKLGDSNNLANVLCNLGDLAHAQNNILSAKQHFEECLQLSRSTKNQALVAVVLHNLAATTHLLESWQSAEPLYLESVLLLANLKLHSVIHHCYTGLARAAADKGDLGRAAFLQGVAHQAREQGGFVASESEQAKIAQDCEIVKAQMNPDTFSKIWQIGARLDASQALPYITYQLPLTGSTAERGEN